MAFQAFSEPSNSGSLPWTAEYLESHPRDVGSPFTVDSVKLVSSGKGYILTTSSFQHFLWKNSTVTKQLIEALTHYVENEGFLLQIVLDKKAKDKAIIGVDFDYPVTWFYSDKEKKFSTTEQQSTSSIQENPNPFIPLAPQTPTMHPVAQNAQDTVHGKNTKNRPRGSGMPQ